MKVEQVRCWRISLLSSKGDWETDHYITYPEDNSGHELFQCPFCGKIYSSSVLKSVYGPISALEQLENSHCTKCEKSLKSAVNYPDKYIDKYGVLMSFKRSDYYPEDSESIVMEFESIFE